MTKNYKITKIFFAVFLIFDFWILSFLAPTKVGAQSVSLSISPPLVEVVTKPGEKITQTYTLKNDGDETMATIFILPFEAADEFGDVKLLQSLDEYDPYNSKYWFSIAQANVELDKKFKLGRGSSIDITLNINPGDDTPDGDYYFTLVFRTELDNLFINQNSKTAVSQAQIGSNILLSVNKEGIIAKKAKIASFEAPKIIDSFSKIDFSVSIANIGNGFFKPFGKITVEPLLGKSQTLTLAPLNIITKSTRTIFCIENERIIPCELPSKILIGPYKAKLSFEIDNDKTVYEAQTTIYAIPIYLSLSLVLAIAALIFVKKMATKKGKR
jgi:hypothetical protein